MNKIIDTNSKYPKIDNSILESCIHCGLCLPSCPTYQVELNEKYSPRGRIQLIKEWSNQNIDFNDNLNDSLDTCLMCLSCQTACPSGVDYEEIINSAKIALVQNKLTFKTYFLKFMICKILPNYAILKILYYVLLFKQKLNFDKVIRPVLKFIKQMCKIDLVALYSFAPQLKLYDCFNLKYLDSNPNWQRTSKVFDSTNSTINCSRPPTIDMKYNFFQGCVMEVFYHDTNQSVINVLAKNNYGCLNNPQTCCGALALHNGFIIEATQLAQKNISYFQANDLDIIVSGSGCAAALKHYPKLFDKYSGLYNEAIKFSSRIKDCAQLLPNIKLMHVISEQKLKIAYHPACHLYHAQKNQNDVSAYLKNLEQANSDKIQVFLLEDESFCCGSAGIYNLLNTEFSLKVLQQKIDNIVSLNIDYILTTNPGCELQLKYGLRAIGSKIEVLHVYEFIDKFVN